MSSEHAEEVEPGGAEVTIKLSPELFRRLYLTSRDSQFERLVSFSGEGGFLREWIPGADDNGVRTVRVTRARVMNICELLEQSCEDRENDSDLRRFRSLLGAMLDEKLKNVVVRPEALAKTLAACMRRLAEFEREDVIGALMKNNAGQLTSEEIVVAARQYEEPK